MKYKSFTRTLHQAGLAYRQAGSGAVALKSFRSNLIAFCLMNEMALLFFISSFDNDFTVRD